MRIALAQVEVIPGKPQKTLEKMLEKVDQAKKVKADLVAFPEMTFGYLVGDRWDEDDYCREMMRFNKSLIDASEGIAIAWGNIYLDDKIQDRVQDGKPHPNKDGRTRKYNAAYVYQNGKPAKKLNQKKFLPEGISIKTLLPEYRVFEDVRHFFGTMDVANDFGVPFESLIQPTVIEVNGKEELVGIETCEDMWCVDYRKDGAPINVTKILIENGAQKIINLSASPWTYGKNDARDRRVATLKKEIGEDFKPFYYVNCTGAQNNSKNILTFDGGSTVYNVDGQPIRHASAPYAEELMIIDDTELQGPVVPRVEKPMIAQKYDAIITGIRSMKNFMNRDDDPKHVIGLSGGVDSALVLSLLEQAIGKDKILAVNMPTIYNSEKTKNIAQHVAESLGVKYRTVPIQKVVELNRMMLESVDIGSGKRELTTLELENLQAKERGKFLSNLAAMVGGIMTNNANKNEIAFNYCTLYGDTNGAYAPIGDLLKREVFEMARFMNSQIYGREIIPEALLPDELCRFGKDQVAPTAELKDAQKDPMKFFYEDALIEAKMSFMKKSVVDIMTWYKEGSMEKNLKISNALIKRWNIDEPQEFISHLLKFDRQIEAAFKRAQLCMNIATSPTEFGYDKRESIMANQEYEKATELSVDILTTMKRYEQKVFVN